MKLKSNHLRILVQSAVIILILLPIILLSKKGTFNPEAYCPYGGLQALSSFGVNNALACDMTTVQITMGILLALSIILAGKLFCSYLCPLGFLNELLTKSRNYLNIKEITIKDCSLADIILRSVKYILLFTVFYYSISSSELFCKQFDPYYALVTGFKGEINLWLAMAAVYLLLIGSFFIRMFWCRYICPLGATSNIFRYFISTLILMFIYFLASLAGYRLPWQLLLGAICLAGYLCEILLPDRFNLFPLMKIKREKDKCIENCADCAAKCPYNIPVNKVDTVTHPDCTMCCDCIAGCKYSALSVNRYRRAHWFIPAAVLLLVFAGIFAGKRWEMPMIDAKWGNYDSVRTESFEIHGLRSIKCYASSLNFVKKMNRTEGVYGVKTYIQKHRAVILYNPEETSPAGIRKAIYTPVKFKISQPAREVKQIAVITLHTENMTDPVDVNYLGMQFRSGGRKYYGLTSQYSAPLTLKLYMDINEPVDLDYIRNTVEMKEMEIMMHGGKVRKERVDFKFINAEDKIDTVTKRELLELLFRPYKKMLNEKVDTGILSIFDIVYPDIEKPLVARSLPVLANYLSLSEGFMGLETTLNNEDDPVIRIYYNKERISQEKIKEILSRKKWKVMTKSGMVKEMDAVMIFY